MDAWHGMLLSALGSMATALGVVWRAFLKKDKETIALRKQLDEVHLDRAHDAQEHIQDVKTLAKEAIELARAATYAPPLSRSEPPPPDSEG